MKSTHISTLTLTFTSQGFKRHCSSPLSPCSWKAISFQVGSPRAADFQSHTIAAATALTMKLNRTGHAIAPAGTAVLQ